MSHLQQMRQAHKVLCEYGFDIVPIKKGYSHRILRIDLDKNEITIQPVTEQMIDLWTGGKGFDLWLMFKEINKDTKWNSNNNPICFSSGPLGGTVSFPGSGKTLVTTISPITQSVMDCNVGGYFGPYFKFAGFDALVIIGKAKEESIILIDAVAKKITIETAPNESIDSHLIAEELTEIYANDDLDKKNIAVVSSGKAAEHSRMGMLNFSFWDWRRSVARLKQAGRGGVGTVFRDKKLKAIVMKNRNITPSWRIEESKVAHLVTPKKISVQSCQDQGEIKAIINKWDNNKEFLAEILFDIQDKYRHISKTAIDDINKYTGVPKSKIYHMITFHPSFSLTATGETLIQVCTGTACHVKGSGDVLRAFEKLLGIKTGETTKDNKYTLAETACLRACSLAPVIKIGDELIGPVDALHVEQILKNYHTNLKAIKSGTPETSVKNTTKLDKKELDRIKDNQHALLSRYQGLLMLCNGSNCATNKGIAVKKALTDALQAKKLSAQYLVMDTNCHGFCAAGPVLVIQPHNILYHKVNPGDVIEIIEKHLLQGQIVERLLYKDPQSKKNISHKEDIAFYNKQQLIALRNKGLMDPQNIEHYIGRDGYQAVAKALTMDSGAIINEIKTSGLKGRGGAGYPTGLKWEACLKVSDTKKEPVYIACNANDRTVIEIDPHSVIEGMTIGAIAMKAAMGFIYIRKEYKTALVRLHAALNQARERGLLGNHIMGSTFSFDITIHHGTGSLITGESSALIDFIGGGVGEPQAKYIHAAERGYHKKPTLLNNVETWANIPVIIHKGAAYFKSIGSHESGTKVLSLLGNVNQTGFIEVALGTPLKDIIQQIGGGIPKNRSLKAVHMGGASGGFIPANKTDIPLTYQNLAEIGAIFGSGETVVMDERTCIVDKTCYFVQTLLNESCGKCTSCREGLFAAQNILTRITKGDGQLEDLEFLAQIAETMRTASLCQFGVTAANPILTSLNYFKNEYLEHVNHKKCSSGICKDLVTYHINKNCTGCTLCAKNCTVNAISGDKKALHTINTALCIKCGICYDKCNFNAVEVK